MDDVEDKLELEREALEEDQETPEVAKDPKAKKKAYHPGKEEKRKKRRFFVLIGLRASHSFSSKFHYDSKHRSLHFKCYRSF